MIGEAPNETSVAPPREGVRQLWTREAWRTLVRSPRVFLANLRQGPEYFRDRRREVRVDAFDTKAVPEAEAVAAAVGVTPAEYRRAVGDLWIPKADPSEPLSVWNGRVELLRAVGASVRLARPAVMVETGVALGFTTATVLRAMDEAGKGQLYSIDLPALQFDPRREVGEAVPAGLRGRWILELGDSRTLLPQVCELVAPIDIFLHDALHTYSSQLREYRTAWPHLRAGGLLISDDVGNPAFLDFAREVGRPPHLFVGENRATAVGLLRKS